MKKLENKWGMIVRDVKDARGYTVVIAMGISGLLMFFSLGLGLLVTSTTNEIKAFKQSSRAYFVAESLMAKFEEVADKHEAGWGLDPAMCKVESHEIIMGMMGCECAEGYTDCGAVFDPLPGGETQGFSTPLAEQVFDCSGDGRTAMEAGKLAEELSKMKVKCNVTGDTPTRIPETFSGEKVEACESGDGCLYTVPGVTSKDISTECGSYGTPVQGLLHGNPKNLPCMWGKLNFGNSYTSRVAIPLYKDVGILAQEIDNPVDLGLNKLKIRLRTPCKPIEKRSCSPGSTEPKCKYENMCEDGDRYELEDGGGSVIVDDNPVVVMWQISGECTKAGKTEQCALIPYDQRDPDEHSQRLVIRNSTIYSSLINDMQGSNYEVLNIFNKAAEDLRKWDIEKDRIDNACEEEYPCPYPWETIYVQKFLLNQGIWSDQTIGKPVLQLSIIARNLKGTGGSASNPEYVPNLEYQILTDAPVANSASAFTVEVNYDGRAYKMEKKIEQKKNVVDFAVQN